MYIKISDGVGNNLKNKTEDVLQAKSALNRLGYFHPSGNQEPHGYVTREFDMSIKKFQKENSLRIDGIMFPSGETETMINRQSYLKKINDEKPLPALPPPSVESEVLEPEERNIPGTNIPDRSVPEQGYPRSYYYRNNKNDPAYKIDESIMKNAPEPMIDPRGILPYGEQYTFKKRKEWGA